MASTKKGNVILEIFDKDNNQLYKLYKKIKFILNFEIDDWMMNLENKWSAEYMGTYLLRKVFIWFTKFL